MVLSSAHDLFPSPRDLYRATTSSNYYNSQETVMIHLP